MHLKKLSELGITGRKLVIEGSLWLVAGVLLILFDTWLPSVVIHLFLWTMIVMGAVDIVMKLAKRVPMQEPLWLTLVKELVAIWLAGNALVVEIPVWVIVVLMGVYELFMAFINGVTYYIYMKDGIRPRARLLWDAIWLVVIGGSTLTAVSVNTDFQMLVLGIYFVRLGYTSLRDGLRFESEVGKPVLKRRVRVGMPMALAALIPRATLQKINNFLAENNDVTASEAYDVEKGSREPDLEIFIHVTEDGFGAIGHVDLCYQGRMISFGNYDTNSERLFGMVGDGVLFETDREKYIEFCKRKSHKTLLGYGLALTPEQLSAIDTQIAQLKSMTIPWTPDATVRPKQPTDKEEPMYAYELMTETGARLYKFTESKFKTYFVLSTNCVLLADSIVGKAGTDILSVKGFIAPGTYQEYLNAEFERPHSMVITKRVYQ